MEPKGTFTIDDYSILMFTDDNGKEHVEVWPIDGIADDPFFILETFDRKTIETCIDVYRIGFDAGEEVGKAEAQKVIRKLYEKLWGWTYNKKMVQTLPARNGLS